MGSEVTDVEIFYRFATALGLGLLIGLQRERAHEAEPDSMLFAGVRTFPFELGPALKFGLLYGLVLLFARAAQVWFGDGGVYVSSVLAGLTDVDAITLSMAELSQPGGGVETSVAARAVTLAAMSNTVVKGGLVLSTGGAELKRAMLPGFLLILAAGLAAAFLG